MTKRRLVVALALLAGATLPTPGHSQFNSDSRHGGFHLGVSGVGSTAAIGLQGEVALTENVSVGGWVDTWSYGQTFGVVGSTIDWDVRYIAFAATGAYHFPIESQPKLDLFAGGALGYFIVRTSASGTTGVFTGDGSRLFCGAHGGARYWFNEKLAGLAQLGVGASYLTLGLDFAL